MRDPLAELAQLAGVASATAGARDAVDAVLRDRGKARIGAGPARASRRASAEASAALTDAPERWLPGTRRAIGELPALGSLVRVAPGQVLARLHSLAAYGCVPEETLGRLRADPEVAGRMQGVTRLLSSNSSAPAIVLGAVVHAELATFEPFGTADGVVARAVERLVLMATGVDPAGVIVVEAGHAADPGRYRETLAGYASGRAAGVQAWLLHCADAITLGADRWAALASGSHGS